MPEILLGVCGPVAYLGRTEMVLNIRAYIV
jgi:hypothetical protein